MNENLKFRIEGGPSTTQFRVWIGDVELTNSITGLDLHLDIHDVPRLELRMLTHKGGVDASGELHTDALKMT